MSTADPITIPLTVDGAKALEILESFSQAMGKAAEKTADAGEKAKASGVSWTEMKSAIDLVSGAFGRLVSLADQVAALTSEQQQLTASAQRLGLDFNQAADGAGRFVDETEAMAAASRLAEAGLHLTQEQLNQLTARAAIASQRLGVDTTTAFNMLTTAIESGSARALRSFGDDMVQLAGATHSMEERANAFAQTTTTMARATDDASTSMARLRDSVGDAEREMASSFSAEIGRLATLSTQFDHTGHAIDDSTEKMRAAGQTAALVLSGIANAMGAVLGTFATGVLIIVGGVRVAMAEIDAIAHFRDPRAAHAAAMAENFGSDSAAMAAAQFVGDRVAALRALAGDEGDQSGRAAARGLITGAAMPRNAGTASDPNTMVFGDSQADADEAYRTARHRGAGAAASAARARRQAQEEMAIAIQQKVNAREALVQQTAIEVNRPEYEAQMAERRAELERVNREGSRETAAENTARGKHAAEDTSIGARMQGQLRQYGDTTRHVRDQVVSAMSDMTEAVAAHFEAWVKGREGFQAAAQGMLSDFLGAVAKRASVSAAEEAAAALASLAVGNFPGAGLHAAAAAGFGVVAGLAGLASQAVAPAPATPHGGAASGTRSAADVTPRAAGKGDAGQVVNVYFGGPVIGAGGARQAARDIVGILNDGARQGGVRLTPNLMPVTP